MRQRKLDWTACYNVRDLGGYSAQNAQQTRWQTFIRSDNLCRLTPEGQKALLAYGVTTIIDLRCPYELSIDPPIFTGQNPPYYQNLPLLDEADTEGMNFLDKPHTNTELYCFILDRYHSQMAAIFRAIATFLPGCILFHCHSGKDRTGLVAALLLALVGVSPQTIVEDYALSTVYLRPFSNKLLAATQHDLNQSAKLRTMYAAPAVAMFDSLAYLDTQYNGPARYLLTCGITQPELDYIQAHFVL